MDRISPYSMDKVFKQDGSVLKNAGWALDEDTLRRLTDAAVDKAGELCRRMRDGEIGAAPMSDRNGSVCRWCGYHAICRAGKEQARLRDAEVTWQDIAGKNTLRENEK
jgi:ATP-dependent helicase/DNAse subunit B